MRAYDRVSRERDYAAYRSRRETFFHLREKSARDFVSISTRLVKLLRDVLSLFSVRNSVTQECEGKLLRSNSTNLYLRCRGVREHDRFNGKTEDENREDRN